MFCIIKEDFRKSSQKNWSIINYLLLCFSSKGVAAVKDYSPSNWFCEKGLAKIIQSRKLRLHGREISCIAKIGLGFASGHSPGIVIGGVDNYRL